MKMVAAGLFPSPGGDRYDKLRKGEEVSLKLKQLLRYWIQKR